VATTWPAPALPPSPQPSLGPAPAAAVALFLFGCTACFAGCRFSCRAGKPSGDNLTPVGIGMCRRRFMVGGLLAANIVRCISLAAEMLLQSHACPWITKGLSYKQVLWLEDLIWLMPATLFLSVFSLVVFFWASLHYTATIAPVQMLDWAFICMNLVCFVLLIVVAVSTFAFKAYDHFWSYMICVLGLVNFVVGISLGYYGVVLTQELSDTAKRKLPTRFLLPRAMLLSIVCPCGLFVRGFVYIAWDLSLGRPSFLLDLVLCGISEWVPSVCILAALLPISESVRSSVDGLDDSTDNESPLLRSAATPPTQQKNFPGMPGRGWKQLYPRPADQ